MNISYAGFNFIQDREGLVLHAYKPVKAEAKWTIGYGHSGPDVHQGMVITPEIANHMLRDDLQLVTACVNRSVSIPLQQCEYDALCSLIINIGCGAWRQSHARECLNNADYLCFHKQAFGDRGWIHDATGQENEGLKKRRLLEADLFFSNDYNDSHGHRNLV